MDSDRLATHDIALPNVIVVIDLREGEPTAPSLFALSEGRRVARAAGATIYAVVMTEASLDEALVARLGRAGADRILLCEGTGLGAPPLDVTHGAALFAAVERVPPLLVLFPAGGAGRELGGSLASRIGAAFAPSADIEIGEARTPLADGIGRVFLRSWQRDRSGYRRFDPVELERPVVASLAAGIAGPERGTADVELDVVTYPERGDDGVTELASEPDDAAHVPLAATLVVVSDQGHPPDLIGRLRAAAPAGVVVVDLATSAAAIATSAPSTLLAIGGRELPDAGTPRTRTALVLIGEEPSSSSSAAPADVVYTERDAARATAALVEVLSTLGVAAVAIGESPGGEDAPR